MLCRSKWSQGRWFGDGLYLPRLASLGRVVRCWRQVSRFKIWCFLDFFLSAWQRLFLGHMMQVNLRCLVLRELPYRGGGEVICRWRGHSPGEVGGPLPQCARLEFVSMSSRRVLSRPRYSKLDPHKDLRSVEALGARPRQRIVHAWHRVCMPVGDHCGWAVRYRARYGGVRLGSVKFGRSTHTLGPTPQWIVYLYLVREEAAGGRIVWGLT